MVQHTASDVEYHKAAKYMQDTYCISLEDAGIEGHIRQAAEDNEDVIAECERLADKYNLTKRSSL
jgi:hypothetical protein